ncbi:21641_t:CDS:1 [Dentiscutata erythropus]|uniref:(d)CMP kinase n=1 Tax=Dentiscutata erythropus TaxID=1348616 RepID=A0A9N9EJC7_9GLOM|nr:21641_t:CDS:1 [Dentiscutata erythropus]
MIQINIAINGPTVSGKTTVGKFIAEKLQYQFINTRIFYRYLGYLSYQQLNNTSVYNILEIFNNNLKLNYSFNNITKIINNLNEEDYYLIGRQGSKLSENQDMRQLINQHIRQITNGKGFVVIGRDVIFNILPDAEVKIVLFANLDTRVLR